MLVSVLFFVVLSVGKGSGKGGFCWQKKRKMIGYLVVSEI